MGKAIMLGSRFGLLAAATAMLGAGMLSPGHSITHHQRPEPKRQRAKKLPKRRDDERAGKSFKLKGIRS